ncbi:MAG: hypothetical protein AAGC88_07475 [Bacteroidota bacterium]
MLPQHKGWIWPLMAMLAGSVLYIHYGIAREDTTQLMGSLVIGFIAYATIQGWKLDWRILLAVGLLIRIALFAGLPTLSDDFYRFIWDGRLLAAGISPFAELPSWYMSEGSNHPMDETLFSLLNSPDYYTVYPPISQFTFWLSAVLSSNIEGAVLVMRSIILITDIANFMLLRLLLITNQKPESLAGLYFLNPLVLLELTGNLHFEGVMLFFVLGALFFGSRKQDIPTGIALAGGVAAKLIPLAMAPLFVFGLLPKRWLVVGVSALITLIILFIPIVDASLIDGLKNSLSLFVQKFEFNGGIYYLIREVGFWVKGYNIIGTLGPWLTRLTVIGIIVHAFLSRKNENMAERMMWVWMIYLALAIIVHPWYCIPMIGLCLFTKYRFPIYWSGLICLSYIGYDSAGYSPPFTWIFVEYVILYTIMLWEIFFAKRNLTASV